MSNESKSGKNVEIESSQIDNPRNEIKIEKLTTEQDLFHENRQLKESKESRLKTKYNLIQSFESFSKRSKTLFNEKDGFEATKQSNIEYGNLTKNYDPNSSITKTTFNPSSEFTYTEIETDDEDYSYQVYRSLFQNKNSKNGINSLDSSLKNPQSDETNLIRKSSLIKLIENNRLNQICCPFDEIVYEQLMLETNEKYDNEIEIITKRRYKRKQSLLEKLKTFEFVDFKPKNNSLDYLLPNCIATFLMKFFFDIFPPSELKMLPPNTLEIVLKLKSLFKPQINLDSELKIAHIIEDILWNCFALFKFKFDTIYSVSFINYFSSLFIILDACKEEKIFKELKFNIGIRKLAPYFIEALILNGLFDQKDFKSFSNFNNRRLISNCVNNEAFEIVQNKMNNNFPMKLKNLCRITIKNAMREFNARQVESLNVPDSIKSFILFNSEFELYYSENKCLIETLKT